MPSQEFDHFARLIDKFIDLFLLVAAVFLGSEAIRRRVDAGKLTKVKGRLYFGLILCYVCAAVAYVLFAIYKIIRS